MLSLYLSHSMPLYSCCTQTRRLWVFNFWFFECEEKIWRQAGDPKLSQIWDSLKLTPTIFKHLSMAFDQVAYDVRFGFSTWRSPTNHFTARRSELNSGRYDLHYQRPDFFFGDNSRSRSSAINYDYGDFEDFEDWIMRLVSCSSCSSWSQLPEFLIYRPKFFFR